MPLILSGAPTVDATIVGAGCPPNILRIATACRCDRTGGHDATANTTIPARSNARNGQHCCKRLLRVCRGGSVPGVYRDRRNVLLRCPSGVRRDLEGLGRRRMVSHEHSATDSTSLDLQDDWHDQRSAAGALLDEPLQIVPHLFLHYAVILLFFRT